MRALAVASWIALTAAGCGALLRKPRSLPPDAGPWRMALARLRADRGASIAACILVAFYAAALLAPWLAPYPPSLPLGITTLQSQPPSLAHPFGTDVYSRDLFSRVLAGSRVSLSIALLAVLISVGVGTACGSVAGYYGGRLDEWLMRGVDAALSVPRLVVLIAGLALWGAAPMGVLVVLLGLTGWFGVSRLVRAEVVALRDRELVVAARALGARDREILWRHILPNVLSPVLVATTLGIANVIVLEAGLSYLGIGVQQPLPSWGNIIQDGGDQVAALWWIALFPGLAIVIAVMAFNALGDGLREALDPRQLPRR